MNFKKGIALPCTKHEGKKIGFICTKKDCKERLICSLCFKGHNDSHKDDFLSVMEVFAQDFGSNYDEIIQLAYGLVKQSEQSTSEIDTVMDDLKEDLNRAVEEIRQQAKQDCVPLNLDEETNKLKHYISQITDCFNQNEEEIVLKRVELADAVSNFLEIKTRVHGLKPSAPYKYENREKNFGKIKQFVQGCLTKVDTNIKKSLSSVSSSESWTWSTSKKSSKVQVSEDGMKATLPQGFSGNHGIIGDKVYKEGVNEWKIEHDPNIKDGFWGIGFGVIEKKKLASITDWESFPYNQAICRATSGTVHNMEAIGEKVVLKGKTARVVLDFEETLLKIYLEDKLLCKATISKGEEYVPFLDFNHSGFANLSF